MVEEPSTWTGAWTTWCAAAWWRSSGSTSRRPPPRSAPRTPPGWGRPSACRSWGSPRRGPRSGACGRLGLARAPPRCLRHRPRAHRRCRPRRRGGLLVRGPGLAGIRAFLADQTPPPLLAVATDAVLRHGGASWAARGRQRRESWVHTAGKLVVPRLKVGSIRRYFHPANVLGTSNEWRCSYLSRIQVQLLDMLKGDVESRQGMTTIPDDLVVDILSRLPLKSFCRFKCVCKSWFSFSSDPHYRQKLPRTPSGLLYKKRELGTAIHLARLPSSDRDIDTTLSFLPGDENPLGINGCSNGLLLSYSQGSMDAEISNAIVCNPATEEWMALPYTQPGPTVTNSSLRLCFDPLWSQHFYVFNFQESYIQVGEYKIEVKVFFSENSAWSSCLWESNNPCWCGSLFVNGVMYMRNMLAHDLLALDAPDTSTQLLNERTIRLPGFPSGPNDGFGCLNGCVRQSCGVLCYAQQELDGSMMRIWSLVGSDEWVVKHRISINNVLGRDIMLRTNTVGSWYFDYDILDFDLEREIVILAERIADNVHSFSPRRANVLPFSISTGKLLEIWNDSEPCWGYYYVPYYRKFPASVLRRAEDEY